MPLLNQCFTFYKTNNCELSNGIRCSEEGVKSMLEGIRGVMMKSLRSSDGQPASIFELHHLEISLDGAFNARNPADIIALVFEVVVEDNGNPLLWNTAGGAGWEGAVDTTLTLFFNGPNGVLVPNRGAGVQETTFLAAKAKLKQFMDKSRNLFR